MATSVSCNVKGVAEPDGDEVLHYGHPPQDEFTSSASQTPEQFYDATQYKDEQMHIRPGPTAKATKVFVADSQPSRFLQASIVDDLAGQMDSAGGITQAPYSSPNIEPTTAVGEPPSLEALDEQTIAQRLSDSELATKFGRGRSLRRTRADKVLASQTSRNAIQSEPRHEDAQIPSLPVSIGRSDSDVASDSSGSSGEQSIGLTHGHTGVQLRPKPKRQRNSYQRVHSPSSDSPSHSTPSPMSLHLPAGLPRNTSFDQMAPNSDISSSSIHVQAKDLQPLSDTLPWLMGPFHYRVRLAELQRKHYWSEHGPVKLALWANEVNPRNTSPRDRTLLHILQKASTSRGRDVNGLISGKRRWAGAILFWQVGEKGKTCTPIEVTFSDMISWVRAAFVTATQKGTLRQWTNRPDKREAIAMAAHGGLSSRQLVNFHTWSEVVELLESQTIAIEQLKPEHFELLCSAEQEKRAGILDELIRSRKIRNDSSSAAPAYMNGPPLSARALSPLTMDSKRTSAASSFAAVPQNLMCEPRINRAPIRFGHCYEGSIRNYGLEDPEQIVLPPSRPESPTALPDVEAQISEKKPVRTLMQHVKDFFRRDEDRKALIAAIALTVLLLAIVGLLIWALFFKCRMAGDRHTSDIG